MKAPENKLQSLLSLHLFQFQQFGMYSTFTSSGHFPIISKNFFFISADNPLDVRNNFLLFISTSHHQILIFTFQLYIYPLRNSIFHTILMGTALLQTREHRTSKRLYVDKLLSNNFPHTCLNVIHSSDPFVGIFCL